MSDQKVNNLVAKHAHKVNKAKVYRDRKKDYKKGLTKHNKHGKINT